MVCYLENRLRATTMGTNKKKCTCTYIYNMLTFTSYFVAIIREHAVAYTPQFFFNYYHPQDTHKNGQMSDHDERTNKKKWT